MATAIPRRLDVSKIPRVSVSDGQRPLAIHVPIFQVRRTMIMSLIFGALTFASALYYVEQQVQLRTLNYDIIALKQQKKELVEYQKTLQLQLDYLKRLDMIEADMLKQGFRPIEEGQLRIVPPDAQSK